MAGAGPLIALARALVMAIARVTIGRAAGACGLPNWPPKSLAYYLRHRAEKIRHLGFERTPYGAA